MTTDIFSNVCIALRGDKSGAEAVKHELHKRNFIEMGSWLPYQRDFYKPDQVITLTTLRFQHRADGSQLLKPTEDSNSLKLDPTFHPLDLQFRAAWAELQWEAADGGNWLWTDAERALLYQFLIRENQMSEIDRLKVELWKLLGGFETPQPPGLLAA